MVGVGGAGLMLTLLQFAAALRAAAAHQPEAEHHGLTKGAELIETEAKALIGQEREAWPALADSTVAQKQAKGQTGRISSTDPLYATGELRATIGHTVNGRTALIGTPDPVGVFQEFGTTKIPARSFLGAAAFRKGEAAAKAIGETVQHAVAGRKLP